MSKHAMAIRLGSGHPTRTSRSVTPETPLTATATTPGTEEKSPPVRRSNLELFFASARCTLSKKALIARLREYQRAGTLDEVIARLVAAVLTGERSIFNRADPPVTALRLICAWGDELDDIDIEQTCNLRALLMALWNIVDAHTRPRHTTA